jgi:ferrous iron transport protein B
MAARTIANPRDRLVTIMIAPLMTCSARLPVYALLIGAFMPQRTLAGGLQLQGLVLFGLYVAGIVGALAVAWVLKRLTARAARCAR